MEWLPLSIISGWTMLVRPSDLNDTMCGGWITSCAWRIRPRHSGKALPTHFEGWSKCNFATSLLFWTYCNTILKHRVLTWKTKTTSYYPYQEFYTLRCAITNQAFTFYRISFKLNYVSHPNPTMIECRSVPTSQDFLVKMIVYANLWDPKFG